MIYRSKAFACHLRLYYFADLDRRVTAKHAKIVQTRSVALGSPILVERNCAEPINLDRVYRINIPIGFLSAGEGPFRSFNSIRPRNPLMPVR